ncbi:MAG: short-chain dehydrogenase, partial [Sphingobacteriales bacterium]
MTAEQIEKVLNGQSDSERIVTISFKNRNNFTGVFVKGNDFDELKIKNFWRIVSLTNQEQ